MRFVIVVLSLSIFSFSSHAGVYLQGEVNKLDVQTDLAGAKVEGNGFGVRGGWRWTRIGLEGGYTTAKGELNGQIFSPTDKYEVDFTLITAGMRWWIVRWLDLSLGAVSASGKTSMQVTIPLLGTISGDGSYTSTGYYLGLGVNIPIKRMDIFLAYNMYRWAEKEFEGSLSGAKSDTGINTLAAGLRFSF